MSPGFIDNHYYELPGSPEIKRHCGIRAERYKLKAELEALRQCYGDVDGSDAGATG